MVFLTIHLQPMSTLTTILTIAQNLFIRYGVRGISMDEIAREAGKSKKTIYELVPDKKSLVHLVMKNFVLAEVKICEKCIEDNENAIDQILAISQHVSSTFKNINPALIQDIQRLYPRSWQLFNMHRMFIDKTMKTNIETGIKQGVFRDDLNVEITVALYQSMIDTVVDSQNSAAKKGYSFKEIHREMMIYHLHGVLNENGKKYLKQNKIEFVI